MEITHILQSWYQTHHRDLPWRQTHDAYRIWLSEIILQQTRVVQGYDYYVRFVKAFPSITDLANATQDEVLKLWQGLGYYSRARNLHKAAIQVQETYGGTFPSRYAELIHLAGVGPYTAAAIASFSSGEAIAVVDGNVYRVLSRLFDLSTPIDSSLGQKSFFELATQLLDKNDPGLHNQAIMEFGALQCTPTSPDCPNCPLQDKCLAYANQTIDERPVKANKVKVRERHLTYVLFKYKNTLWVHQRGPGDIWQGLWEFYLIRNEELEMKNEAVSSSNSSLFLLPSSLFPPHSPLFTLRHQLTHQLLICDFYAMELSSPITTLPKEYIQITWEEWQSKAVSKLIVEANKRFSTLFE